MSRTNPKAKPLTPGTIGSRAEEMVKAQMRELQAQMAFSEPKEATSILLQKVSTEIDDLRAEIASKRQDLEELLEYAEQIGLSLDRISLPKE